MTTRLIQLPHIALQPSTSCVFRDVSDHSCDIAVEDVWISFYPPKDSEDAPGRSLHGKLRLSETDDDGQVELTVREGSFEAKLLSPCALEVSCASLSIPSTRLLLPSPTANTPASGSSRTEEIPAPAFVSSATGINCFAVSHDRRRIALGSRDGQCRIIEVVAFEDDNPYKLRKGKEIALRGHVGDITCIEFFPSNEVVLTASSDMSLRVFSANDGTCPRHLRGHTKRVTGTRILAEGQHKGREVLSSSLDGTLRLWDLSVGDSTKTWHLSQPISALEVISSSSSSNDDAANVLAGKFALCGHPDGTISMVSLLSSSDSTPCRSSTIFRTSGSSTAVETLSYDSKTRLLASGHRDGVVSLFRVTEDAPSETEALIAWRRTEGSQVHSVQWLDRQGTLSLLVAGSDGLPYRVAFDYQEETGSVENVRVVDEFVGSNCDPCTEVHATGEGTVWISGGPGDGTIRIYEL